MWLEDPKVVTYLVYVWLSVLLTVWVAYTLRRNGRVFLVDVFRGNDKLADSVNHLLVVGFYLVNLGYVSLALKTAEPIESAQRAIEVLSWKVGLVLCVLGVMHFINVVTFSSIRRRAILENAPPPVAPDERLPPAGPSVPPPLPAVPAVGA
jgi:hypothetical protein